MEQLFKCGGRRIGKTTRLVDQAIQYLFEKGELALCYGRRTDESIFIDPDHEDRNMAQERFIAVLMKRIRSEHKSFVEIEVERACINFKVKK